MCIVNDRHQESPCLDAPSRVSCDGVAAGSTTRQLGEKQLGKHRTTLHHQTTTQPSITMRSTQRMRRTVFGPRPLQRLLKCFGARVWQGPVFRCPIWGACCRASMQCRLVHRCCCCCVHRCCCCCVLWCCDTTTIRSVSYATFTCPLTRSSRRHYHHQPSNTAPPNA